jgi:hypothetical protein
MRITGSIAPWATAQPKLASNSSAGDPLGASHSRTGSGMSEMPTWTRPWNRRYRG